MIAKCTRCEDAHADYNLTEFFDSLGEFHKFCEACYAEYQLYKVIPCPSH